MANKKRKPRMMPGYKRRPQPQGNIEEYRIWRNRHGPLGGHRSETVNISDLEEQVKREVEREQERLTKGMQVGAEITCSSCGRVYKVLKKDVKPQDLTFPLPGMMHVSLKGIEEVVCPSCKTFGIQCSKCKHQMRVPEVKGHTAVITQQPLQVTHLVVEIEGGVNCPQCGRRHTMGTLNLRGQGG